MSYQSIKRVLGQSNLEIKIRILFSLSLMVLIAVVFYWVEKSAEYLVLKTTRANARDLVDLTLLKLHFESYETRPDEKQIVREQIAGLHNAKQQYKYNIIAMDNIDLVAMDSFTGSDGTVKRKTLQPKDEVEEQIILGLIAELDKRKAEANAVPPEPVSSPAAIEADLVNDEPAVADLPPVFADRRLPELNEYHYFEAIRWAKGCDRCHWPTDAPPDGAAGDAIASLPPRFIKVAIPYKPTQDAMRLNWSILVGAWAVTVFAAIVMLTFVVRYVIAKPLQHLREVADAIRSGKTETRAEIATNDEFEELADSFNRMLIHMTDSQEELERLNSELDRRVDQLAQLNVRLHEMNQIKGEFLANMSHELRTPLNSIIGFSEVLSGLDALTDKQRRFARNIHKSGRLLLEMINDILDLAKLEAGKMDLRLTEFRIDTMVTGHCDIFRPLIDSKNILLECKVQDDVPPLFQDQAKVQQILTNLLSNAIKFTPEGGRITVSAFMAKNGMLHLSVEDTGVGIPDEDREIIFEKFRQSSMILGEDSLTREYSGTGLGLSIVKEICKLLGGEISFTSELGAGSTFMVRLPWTISEPPRLQKELDDQLQKLTRTGRLDFKRAATAPQVDDDQSPSPDSSATMHEGV